MHTGFGQYSSDQRPALGPLDDADQGTCKDSLQACVQRNMELARQIRDSIPSGRPAGAVSLQTVGPVVDTLPAGAVFGGATPPAGCEPGCVGTTPERFRGPVRASCRWRQVASCDISLNVTFPSGILASGDQRHELVDGARAPVAEGLQPLGTAQTTHPVTTFEPNPSATLVKNLAAGSPNPPVLNQTFSYDLAVGNNGNVVLDNTVVTDALPAEMQVTSVTTGACSTAHSVTSRLGEGVRVSSTRHGAGRRVHPWGSSPLRQAGCPESCAFGETLVSAAWRRPRAASRSAQAELRPVVEKTVRGSVEVDDVLAFCVDIETAEGA